VVRLRLPSTRPVQASGPEQRSDWYTKSSEERTEVRRPLTRKSEHLDTAETAVNADRSNFLLCVPGPGHRRTRGHP
jgi:hypothetical protein